MAGLNMANINMLIKKVYLLAGVIIAANMFAWNEMKAMDKDKIVFEIEGIGNEENTIGVNNDNKMKFFTKDSTRDTTRDILFRENAFNFFGTLALSGANNYFNGGIIIRGCIGSLDVLDGDLKD